MKKIKIAFLGFGNRGSGYASYAVKHPDEYIVTAIIEKNKDRLYAEGFEEVKKFTDAEDFIANDTGTDVVCIATQDREHYQPAMQMLRAGYDIILEKPISNDLKECQDILEESRRTGKNVFVCHVLRYTDFYRAIKDVLNKKRLGRIINIQTNENIGFWHMAHSYVRGPWRSKENSNPIILAKCCHDLDLICWYMGEKCVSVNSIGELTWFKKENRPKNAADYCSDCPARDGCVFDSIKIYPYHPWCNVYYMKEQPTLENIKKYLPHSQYDRCVYNCDNDVCDHQSVIMRFESGAIATHTLSAFSQTVYRKIHIQGTEGELFGVFDEYVNELKLRCFDGTTEDVDISAFKYESGSHGGGDNGFMHEVYRYLNGEKSFSVTTVDQSVMSHEIAFKAEESRLDNGAPKFL